MESSYLYRNSATKPGQFSSSRVTARKKKNPSRQSAEESTTATSSGDEVATEGRSTKKGGRGSTKGKSSRDSGSDGHEHSSTVSTGDRETPGKALAGKKKKATKDMEMAKYLSSLVSEEFSEAFGENKDPEKIVAYSAKDDNITDNIPPRESLAAAEIDRHSGAAAVAEVEVARGYDGSMVPISPVTTTLVQPQVPVGYHHQSPIPKRLSLHHLSKPPMITGKEHVRYDDVHTIELPTQIRFEANRRKLDNMGTSAFTCHIPGKDIEDHFLIMLSQKFATDKAAGLNPIDFFNLSRTFPSQIVVEGYHNLGFVQPWGVKISGDSLERLNTINVSKNYYVLINSTPLPNQQERFPEYQSKRSCSELMHCPLFCSPPIDTESTKDSIKFAGDYHAGRKTTLWYVEKDSMLGKMVTQTRMFNHLPEEIKAENVRSSSSNYIVTKDVLDEANRMLKNVVDSIPTPMSGLIRDGITFELYPLATGAGSASSSSSAKSRVTGKEQKPGPPPVKWSSSEAPYLQYQPGFADAPQSLPDNMAITVDLVIRFNMAQWNGMKNINLEVKQTSH